VLTQNQITGQIITVNGLVAPSKIQVTMAHEHILLWLGPVPNIATPPLALDNVSLQTTRVKAYVADGGNALISMSNHGLRWDAPGAPKMPFPSFPGAMKQVATGAGASIILGTGYYKYSWQSAATQALSVTGLYQTIINDIFTGQNGVNAGIIGEIGITNAVTDVTLVLFEWKSLVAACQAVIQTGLAMNVHTDIGTPGPIRLLVLDICQQLNVPLGRVIMSHLDPGNEIAPGDLAVAQTILGLGANCCFDLIGHEGVGSAADTATAQGIATLIGDGFVNQILLSQDIYDEPDFFGKGVTYTYMTDTFVPMLTAAGVTSAQITQMRVTNPQNLIAVATPTTPAQPIVLTSLPGITTTAPVTIGILPNLLEFAGGFLSVAVPPAIQPTIPFTISTFIQAILPPLGTVCIADCALTQGIIGKTWPQVAGSGWALYANAAGIQFSVGTGGDGEGDSTIITASGSGNVFDGQWHNIAGVSDGDNLTVYIDGVAGTPVSIDPSMPVAATGNLTIGSGGGQGIFIGSLQSLTFYPSTAAQISAMAAGPGSTT
jgi:phosphotriesterase-related protein